MSDETETKNKENVGYDNLRILENIEVNLTANPGTERSRRHVCRPGAKFASETEKSARRDWASR